MAIYLPVFFHAKTQRRKDANLLLLLSTHYPHQAVISTRKTRMWLICTDFWNNGYLPARFCFTQRRKLVVSTITGPILFHAKTQRRKDANLLLLLSTHYPHQAAISTRITRLRLICTDFWNNGYLPARFFSRKDAKAQIGYYCLIPFTKTTHYSLTTNIRHRNL